MSQSHEVKECKGEKQKSLLIKDNLTMTPRPSLTDLILKVVPQQ